MSMTSAKSSRNFTSPAINVGTCALLVLVVVGLVGGLVWLAMYILDAPVREKSAATLACLNADMDVADKLVAGVGSASEGKVISLVRITSGHYRCVSDVQVYANGKLQLERFTLDLDGEEARLVQAEHLNVEPAHPAH
jgi:hypothetical protein